MLKHTYIKWIFLIAILLLFVGFCIIFVPIYYLIFTLVLWLGITTWASFDIRSNYFVKTHISNPTIKEQHIALTFDDGPTAFTPLVLDLLNKYQQKATFFCIGKQIEKYPEIAKRILSEEHLIANHTYTHTNKMGFLSKNEVSSEIASTQNIIQQVAGKIPHLFRPPFGVTNPNIARACRENGVEVVGWNIRSLDTVIDVEDKILNRIVPRLKKGSIVLLHDTSQKTVNVLERLLQVMNEKNIQSVTVDELLKIKAYK